MSYNISDHFYVSQRLVKQKYDFLRLRTYCVFPFCPTVNVTPQLRSDVIAHLRENYKTLKSVRCLQTDHALQPYEKVQSVTRGLRKNSSLVNVWEKSQNSQCHSEVFARCEKRC